MLGWYALNGFTHFMGDLAIVPTVVLIGAFSLAARRGQLLPTWLVWVGLAIVAAGSVGMVGILAEVGALYPFWFVGLFGYFLWILAVSVTFLVRLRRSRAAPAGLRSKRRDEGRSVRSHGGFEPSAWRTARGVVGRQSAGLACGTSQKRPPGRIRTCDHWLRSPLLYPAELQGARCQFPTRRRPPPGHLAGAGRERWVAPLRPSVRRGTRGWGGRGR